MSEEDSITLELTVDGYEIGRVAVMPHDVDDESNEVVGLTALGGE